MRIPLSVFMEHVIKHYNLKERSLNGYVCVDIRGSMYGLPHASSLTKKYGMAAK